MIALVVVFLYWLYLVAVMRRQPWDGGGEEGRAGPSGLRLEGREDMLSKSIIKPNEKKVSKLLGCSFAV